MESVFPERLKKLWDVSEVRGTVLLSLFLQTILVLFGSRRKYKSGSLIMIILWMAYMSADWVATVSLSILATNEGHWEDDCSRATYELQAFWAPFLLLHLGGQDNITAYSLEDNELWLRHFLGFLVQVGVAFYVSLRFWSNYALTYLAIPVFVTGIIKYGERIWALRSSSTKHFRDSLLSPPDAGPDLVRMPTMSQDELERVKKAAMIVPDEEIKPEDNSIVQAYYLFKRFEYLFADLILGYYERKGSYYLISGKSAKDAFNLVAIELGFLYDVLYTKATIVYSPLGILFRCVSLFSSLSTLVAFSIIIDMHAYQTIDISITYILLAGAIFLEIYSLINHTFSDWTKLWLIKSKRPRANLTASAASCHSIVSNAIGKRWSGSLAQYNLFSSCLGDTRLSSGLLVYPLHCLGFQKLFGTYETFEKYLNKTWVDIDVDLQELIIMQLQEKGNQIKDESFDIKLCWQILAQRGDHALDRKGCLDEFRWCTVDVEFDHSLLLWHIATDLCCYVDINQRENADGVESGASDVYSKIKLSTYLSNYMLYLLVMCPTMLPKGIGEIRYRDTCAEAFRFFKQTENEGFGHIYKACKDLLEIDTTSLEEKKGDRSQSLLFYGCRLAKQLKSLESEEGWGYEWKWEMISEVWVEMLTYAANRCEWKEHGQQLRRGGELLTHVCVLMTHLGLSEKYQIQKQYINEVDFSSREGLGIIPQILVDMLGLCCCCLCCLCFLPCFCINKLCCNEDEGDQQGNV